MPDQFVALGGGDTIGNSCYYLEMDGCRFLLDCGATWQKGRLLLPDLELLTKAYVDGLWQLDQMILSHAHFDHIGALGYAVQEEGSVHLLANPVTKILTELQLRQFDPAEALYRSEALLHRYRLQKERALDAIEALPFQKTYEGNGYAVTLYKAGHVPGASMAYVQTERHTLLYTGDISANTALLAGGCQLPESPVDILVLEGTHAYNGYNRSGGFQSLVEEIDRLLQWEQTLTLTAANVTKGIELARSLADRLAREDDRKLQIYLDESITPVAEAFEAAHYQVYGPYIQPLGSRVAEKGSITITREGRWGRKAEGNVVLNGNAFTLHADCRELADMVLKLQPSVVLLVHAQPGEQNRLQETLDRRGWQGNLYQVHNRQEYRFT